MRSPRFRLTVRRLMVGVAFVCVPLATFRLHPVLGILGLSIACLTLIRTWEIVDRTAPEGRTIRPGRLVLTFLASALVASVILVGSLLAAMAADTFTYGFMLTGCRFPTTLDGILREQGLPMLVAVSVGYPCAVLFRKALW